MNRKYETEDLVKAYAEATQIHHLEAVRLRTDELDDHRALQASHRGGQRSPRGDLSQSERDWAFAKRALARGDDPEEVIRRIADYRGDEKHPGYPRCTVERAQAQLLQIKSSREDESRTPGGK